jgi:serine/threonine-protein kinase ULK/ATG1
MPSTRTNEGLARRDQLHDRERLSTRTTGGGTSTRHGHAGGGRKSHVEDDEDRIGPYLIGEEIGRGSFATVYKGERYVRSLTRLDL